MTRLTVAIFIAFSVFTAAAGATTESTETPPFRTTVKASDEHANPDNACLNAMTRAEDEANLQAREHFRQAFRLTLESSEQKRRPGVDNQTICEVTGTWTAQPIHEAHVLLGQEKSISGVFEARCPDNKSSDLCWSDIVGQAADQLRVKLSATHGSIDTLTFRYVDFEGWQRDRFQDRYLDVTADGTFYFELVDDDVDNASITLHRSWDRPPVKPETSTTSADELESNRAEDSNKKVSSDPDVMDVTLFYTWDGNDEAATDALAISSKRWGAGLWANNRVGFSVFQGIDRLGIGDNHDNVHNSKQTYETLGIGMGYRLWANRGITVENMLYYVDASPYQGIVAPDCDGCTPRSFQSQNYPQATVNLKTNSHGMNIGWMFTWKFLETDSAFDKLSSGFYLELQF
ncbi:hypothetical protein [Reinekea blandensis]|uniref:Uncharacterized protein n=1 Tax=Reinekea blandensis MED297 TaxID=314283 RepID=A4BJ21_9GAMM|nr:hypothetical protein [Reinekea blandensis]EAR07866.1 hypothetical protein MED297_08601 [Reinekea sp. MED297] [Reinekea blandensis MED297]